MTCGSADIRAGDAGITVVRHLPRGPRTGLFPLIPCRRCSNAFAGVGESKRGRTIRFHRGIGRRRYRVDSGVRVGKGLMGAVVDKDWSIGVLIIAVIVLVVMLSRK